MMDGLDNNFASFVTDMCSCDEFLVESPGSFGEKLGRICCRGDEKDDGYFLNGTFAYGWSHNRDSKSDSHGARCNSLYRTGKSSRGDGGIYCVCCNSNGKCNGSREKVGNNPNNVFTNKHSDDTSPSSPNRRAVCVETANDNALSADVNCNETYRVALDRKLNGSGTIGLNYHPTPGFSKSVVFEEDERGRAWSNAEPGWLWRPIDVAG